MSRHRPIHARVAMMLAIGAVGACDEPTQNTQPSARPAAPKQGLNIDDKHVEARSLLALGAEGETSWRVTVATDVLSCQDLTAVFPGRPETAPGTRVDFWLRRVREPDGALGPWGVRSAYLTDKRAGRGLALQTALLGDVLASSANVKVVGLDLGANDNGKMVTFTGAALAKNCGRVKSKHEPRPQKELTVTVSGKPYEVNGATLSLLADKQHLRLSHAPHGCDTDFDEGFDTYIDIAITGTPPKLAFVSLQGDAYPDSPSGSKGKDTFAIDTAEPLEGTTPIDIKLAGKLDLTGYALTVAGTANVLRCSPGLEIPADAGAPAQLDAGAPKAK